MPLPELSQGPKPDLESFKELSLLQRNSPQPNLPSVVTDIKSPAGGCHSIPAGSSSMVGLMNLEIVSVADLPRVKNFTRTTFDSDPFVIVTFGKLTFKTKFIPHTLNPVFNERLYFNVNRFETNYMVRFSVYDHDKVSNHDHLASTSIPVSQLISTSSSSQSTSHVFPLTLITNTYPNSPTITITSRFTPYTELRRRFWAALSRAFDNDVDGRLNLIELESLLESINSTLSESSINSFFLRYEKNPETDELTIDEFTDAIEDRMNKPDTPPSSPSSASDSSSTISPLSTESQPDNRPVAERVVSIQKCPVCNGAKFSNRSDIDVISHIAMCSSEDSEELGRILMGNVSTEVRAQRKWLSRLAGYMGYGKWQIGKNNAHIIVQNRATGELIEEKMPVYIRLGIRLLYKAIGSKSRLQSKSICRVLNNLSQKQGRKYDDPMSVREIPAFIRFHNLNVTEIRDPLDSFKNFNEFFYRHLKPGVRPISSPGDPNVAVSVADCRCTVYPTVSEATRLWIKGTQFSLKKLFGGKRLDAEIDENAGRADSVDGMDPEVLAKMFEGGAVAIFRLAPQDYHRFHIPVDGVFSEPTFIGGEYYTVNPMAIRSSLDVYGDNKRVVSVLKSPQFGKVAYVCIGAMMVGSIVLTSTPGVPVKRGDEHGYFKFGGSTVVLLFQPDSITFDTDLIKNSADCLETLVGVGNSVGVAARRASMQGGE